MIIIKIKVNVDDGLRHIYFIDGSGCCGRNCSILAIY